MSFNANEVPMSGKNFKKQDPIEIGAYPARIVAIDILGIQPQNPFEGEEKPSKLELSVTYELLDEFMKDEEGEDILDKPRWLSETMPFSNLKADKGKSTIRYKALDPTLKFGGDWSQLLGMPCIVTVAHYKSKKTGETKDKVSAISAMRDKEAAKAPALINPTRLFDFYNPDMEVYEKFPEWVQKKLQGAEDFKGGALDKLLNGKGSGKTQTKEEEKEEVDDTIGGDEEW